MVVLLTLPSCLYAIIEKIPTDALVKEAEILNLTDPQRCEYEELLWTVADHSDLSRSIESILDSYANLFGGGDQPERAMLVSRLNAQGPSCGRILRTCRTERVGISFAKTPCVVTSG